MSNHSFETNIMGLGLVGFLEERGKLEYSKENFSDQGRRPSTGLIQKWR